MRGFLPTQDLQHFRMAGGATQIPREAHRILNVLGIHTRPL